jgi:glutamate synthase domain-containing protein 3
MEVLKMRIIEDTFTIDAKGMHYKELNEEIEKKLNEGYKKIKLINVNGQRYIGAGLTFPDRTIEIYGVPGNDLGVFMNGLNIRVYGNAQDGVGNTMNDGEIVIYGSCGDIIGYGMRGGKIFIKGNVGYRVGIHMKEYKDKIPVIVVGGTAGDFLGEYMAGGRIIILGLEEENDENLCGYFCSTGIHGGIIYFRGKIPEYKLGKEGKILEIDEEDKDFLDENVKRFSEYFNIDYDYIMKKPFLKVIPFNKRPYGKLYAY